MYSLYVVLLQVWSTVAWSYNLPCWQVHSSAGLLCICSEGIVTCCYGV